MWRKDKRSEGLLTERARRVRQATTASLGWERLPNALRSCEQGRDARQDLLAATPGSQRTSAWVSPECLLQQVSSKSLFIWGKFT